MSKVSNFIKAINGNANVATADDELKEHFSKVIGGVYVIANVKRGAWLTMRGPSGARVPVSANKRSALYAFVYGKIIIILVTDCNRY